MHSLKLGGLEFNPSHTVNEHRPKNFTLPDIIIEESSNLTFDLSLLEKGINPTNASTDDAFKEQIAKVGNAPANNSLNDMWNEDLWLNVDFKEMHDPKHRHPRHNGKSYILMVFHFKALRVTEKLSINFCQCLSIIIP